MFSSNVTPPSTLTATPAVVTYLCEAITLLKLCYYYAMHIITIAFACSQIQYKIVTICVLAALRAQLTITVLRYIKLKNIDL